MPEDAAVISLRPVTEDNFEAVIGLKVREDQTGFVASNLYSLAEAYVIREHVPLAIYAGETPVGFAMHTYWQERKEYWIMQLMVAAEHQGRGYGRKAMRMLLERMRAIPGCRAIHISYEPRNDPARRLYQSLGFAVTGQMIDGEEEARLDLPQPREEAAHD